LPYSFSNPTAAISLPTFLLAPRVQLPSQVLLEQAALTGRLAPLVLAQLLVYKG
jgi:hypothetical protein